MSRPYQHNQSTHFYQGFDLTFHQNWNSAARASSQPWYKKNSKPNNKDSEQLAHECRQLVGARNITWRNGTGFGSAGVRLLS